MQRGAVRRWTTCRTNPQRDRYRTNYATCSYLPAMQPTALLLRQLRYQGQRSCLRAVRHRTDCGIDRTLSHHPGPHRRIGVHLSRNQANHHAADASPFSGTTARHECRPYACDTETPANTQDAPNHRCHERRPRRTTRGHEGKHRKQRCPTRDPGVHHNGIPRRGLEKEVSRQHGYFNIMNFIYQRLLPSRTAAKGGVNIVVSSLSYDTSI